MAIVTCLTCSGRGYHETSGLVCRYCGALGLVDSGEPIPLDQQTPPPDALAEWPEEPTDPTGRAPWQNGEAA